MISIQAIGNLASDAEVKNANGKDFCVFRLADSRRWTANDGTKHEETQWFSCIMSRGYENVVSYLKKGVRIFIQGQPSIEIYSSPKDRCMKARYNVQVFQVELVGGQAEAVPRRLVTPDGQLVDIFKAYYVRKGDIDPAVVKQLFGEKGGSYNVDSYGFVWPIEGQSQALVEENNAVSASEADEPKANDDGQPF